MLAQAQDAFVTDLVSRTRDARQILSSARENAASSGTDSSVLINAFRAARAIGGDSIVAVDDTVAETASPISAVPDSLRQRAADAPAGSYFQRATVDGRSVQVAAIVPSQNAADGPRIVVYGFKNLDAESALLANVVRTSVLSIVGVLLATVAVGYVLSRRMTRPLRELDEAVRELGASGDVAPVAVRVPRSGDEIARLAESFNLASHRIDELLADLRHREAGSRQFAEDVAHELRTPLATMLAVTEILEDADTSSADDVQRAAATTGNEVRRLVELVTNLLAVSRPDDVDAATMERDVVDLNKVARRSVSRRGLDADVSFCPSQEPAMVDIDSRRIDLVIANLVTNAVRHGAAPIDVDVTVEADTVSIRVADSGPGISPEALPHLFDRFYKADSARGRSEGSGLGLAIAARNARLHDGSIEVDSTPGDGARFTLVLPRWPEPGEAP
ncbi:HAMP domain-containing histidine kinase [Gordonia sp. HY285]|uniref:sensor histidine kinase n=1 Tax=Gordonia liuliyuniae TaxID=2911517 RepID=UPI001F30D8B3|nr:HAMP domain-containing sensor histidine kinase [Gordonia liuliyuniae]MCF8608912.1 HAMP domain-containing histidine kinase [Gordonia liuliyuniae]